LLEPHELPDLKEVAAFIAVAEDGSFAEAARRLGLAPSSLSRLVAKLENRLGFDVFRRTTRQLGLTEEGAKALSRARDLVGSAEVFADLGSTRGHPSGVINVNAPVSFIVHVLAPRVREFCAAYPDVTVKLSMTDALVDLISAHADVAIRFGQLQDSPLLFRTLGKSAWRLVGAPALLEEAGMPNGIADLQRFQQVAFTNPVRLNDWWFEGHPKPIRIPPAVHADNGEAVRALVLAGCGLAQFSDYMIDADIASGKLVPLLADKLTTPSLQVSALYSEQASRLGRMKVFLDWLSDVTVNIFTDRSRPL
jgi:DNA-binding transcriptional LysR family regulator